MIQVVQKDITKINYIDAIVVAANKNLQIGTGLYKNIHRCAGERLLKECCLLGGCKEGESKITGGYNLPCKYIIHTVAPVWIDGNYREKEILECCYINSLKLALKYDIHSIAFFCYTYRKIYLSTKHCSGDCHKSSNGFYIQIFGKNRFD